MYECMYDTLGPFWVGVEAATISKHVHAFSETPWVYIFFLTQEYLLNEALLIILTIEHA